MRIIEKQYLQYRLIVAVLKVITICRRHASSNSSLSDEFRHAMSGIFRAASRVPAKRGQPLHAWPTPAREAETAARLDQARKRQLVPSRLNGCALRPRRSQQTACAPRVQLSRPT